MCMYIQYMLCTVRSMYVLYVCTEYIHITCLLGVRLLRAAGQRVQASICGPGPLFQAVSRLLVPLIKRPRYLQFWGGGLAPNTRRQQAAASIARPMHSDIRVNCKCRRLPHNLFTSEVTLNQGDPQQATRVLGDRGGLVHRITSICVSSSMHRINRSRAHHTAA